MSRDQSKSQEVPVTTTIITSSLRSITPPRRFLDFATPSRRTFIQTSASLPQRSSTASPVQSSLLQSSSSSVSSTPSASTKIPDVASPTVPVISGSKPTAAEISTLPKLIRFPKVLLTPVDTQFIEKKDEPNGKDLGRGTSQQLPPPPALTKMPISTRKDKRSIALAKKKDVVAESSKTREPPKKRVRTGDRISESSTISEAPQAPATPRKIIQEIFGPDKSKKYKGRKRKRGSGTTPKKGKGQTVITPTQEDQFEESKPEHAEIETETHDNNEEEDVPIMEVDDEEPPEWYQQDPIVDEHVSEEQNNFNTIQEKDISEDAEEVIKEYEQDGIDEDEDKESTTSCTRRVSGRKAKQVANEKLKRLSIQGEGKADDLEEDKKSTKEEPAGIRSRRSTTEGSSKSSNSGTNQEDSESSMGGGAVGGRSYVNRHLIIDRQKSNPTPLSGMSEDPDHDDVKGEGIDGVSDTQEHRDSDVDSTYSWKPVRAAAAAALEQVTKKQGSVTGSTGLPGDVETKAAAVAERRARKIMRYKGRNRRTLLFKSSSSKKLISARHNRNSAQPIILPKVFHHGSYFQTGDIIYIVSDDDTPPQYGQITGILMDHIGETSASIRWLSAKSILYELTDFVPLHYEIRYDLPERLIKIEYINFVMHLNLDFFEGHHSFNKIERFSIYSRVGKSINPMVPESDVESSTNVAQSSNSQSDNEVDKCKDKDDDNDNGNTSDTSVENISDDEEKKAENIEEIKKPQEDSKTDGDPNTVFNVNKENGKTINSKDSETAKDEIAKRNVNNENIQKEAETVVQDMIEEIVESQNAKSPDLGSRNVELQTAPEATPVVSEAENNG